MKTKLFAYLAGLSALVFSLSSCVLSGIRGSGNVTSVNRTIPDFSSIESRICADIVLVQTPSSILKIEAEDNIIPLITLETKGDKLLISSEKSFSTSKSIKIYIPVKELKSVTIQGSGSITGQSPITAQDLSVVVSGSGDVNLNVTARSLRTVISGSGDMVLSGRVNVHETTVSGSGTIKAIDLQTEKTTVTVSGSGTCKVDAHNELDVHVSGSGDVYYKSVTPIFNTSVSGSGDVKKLN